MSPTDSPSPAPKRIVRCPACGGPSVYASDNPFRPFCSERCRLHDLGAWAHERFRVDADDTEASLPDAGPATPH